MPEDVPPRPLAPDAELCRAQLRRVLDSAEFDATDRDRRFLAYVVEEALAGRADRIKAYTIATEVFGRDASFDPQTDPIVRVEAGHLRRALDRYYLSAGRDDPVAIGMPKGGYAPSFTPRARAIPAEPAAPSRPRRRVGMLAAALTLVCLVALTSAWLLRRDPPPPAEPDVPRLAVSPLTAIGGDAEVTRIAAGLTGELVGEIARFRDIVVVMPMSDRGAAPRYLLDGSVAREGDALRVQLKLRGAADGAVVWADGYSADLKSESPFAAEARIASAAATAVGQPYGAVYQADIGDRAGSPVPDGDGDAYACTLAYFGFRARIDAEGYGAVRSCLEAAVERFPRYATAWALLAEIRVDGLRFGLDPAPDLDQALADARHALMLDPSNVRALQAKMMALYFSGDFEGALRVGASAVAINPNDTELLGEYGYRLALSGRWDEGCPILDSAVARNPGPLPYYETGRALCAYIAGDAKEAAARIRAAAFPRLPIYRLIAAALYAEAGEIDAAHAERDWLVANAPALIANLDRRVGARVGRPQDFARFRASLRLAGLPIPPATVPGQ